MWVLRMQRATAAGRGGGLRRLRLQAALRQRAEEQPPQRKGEQAEQTRQAYEQEGETLAPLRVSAARLGQPPRSLDFQQAVTQCATAAELHKMIVAFRDAKVKPLSLTHTHTRTFPPCRLSVCLFLPFNQHQGPVHGRGVMAAHSRCMGTQAL
jgi:hypothetical protein